MIKIEVCANSVQDCLVAQNEGADRIELISASYLGGLTPTLIVLDIPHEELRCDDFDNRKMAFFFDPDGLPLEIHE